MSKRTESPGLGSLGTGAVTAVALSVQMGLAAIVGVIVAREFGRTAETDGFFGAYAVFVMVLLAAGAIRVVVLASLARAREESRLGAEVVAYGLVLALFALPLLVLGLVAAGQLSWLLTWNGPESTRAAATAVLPWMLLASVLQLYAGLAASTLAALDDYIAAAAGYVLGSVSGLVLIVLRVEADGIEAVAWGMALNGAVALLVPAAALAARAWSARMPAAAIRPSRTPLRARFLELARGVSVALSLQALYLVCIPLAGREGVGALTSFSYAYLLASALVAVAATSLGLVTAVPLTRAGIDPSRTVRHVVSSSWIAIVAIGAAAGAFALAGDEIVQALLGPVYGEDVGAELGRVVVALSPWALASVGISVTFPLVFVAARPRMLPVLAFVAVVLQLPLAFVGQAILGLYGLALALAATTAFLLGGMFVVLGVAGPATRGLVVASAFVACLAGAAFAAPWLLLGPALAAAGTGVAAYGVLLAVLRPAPLREAWRYLRTLS